MQEIIKPENMDHWRKLRTRDITSTEIGALFGISPYTTEFELHHRKASGDVVELDENERMKWGTRLQDAIAYGSAKDEGFPIRRMDEYVRLNDIRLGSSFDFRIIYTPHKGMFGVCEMNDTDQDELLEIKNVDGLVYRDGWLVDDDGNVEAPPHIEIQVQHQMLVSGLKKARLRALIGGNQIVKIDREYDHSIAESIIQKAADFWQRIELKQAPAPDFTRDADFIRELYKHAEPGKVVDLFEDVEMYSLASAYRDVSLRIKELEDQKKAIKSQILIAMGDAEKGVSADFSISCGTIGPAVIEAHTRSGYRNFKVNFKKGK